MLVRPVVLPLPRATDSIFGIVQVGNGLEIGIDGKLNNIGAGVPGVEIGDLVFKETPGGAINGTNNVFTLAQALVSGIEQLFLNGILQRDGGWDYSITSQTATFVIAPASGSFMLVNYVKS